MVFVGLLLLSMSIVGMIVLGITRIEERREALSRNRKLGTGKPFTP